VMELVRESMTSELLACGGNELAAAGKDLE
jgi:hypothetical protein